MYKELQKFYRDKLRKHGLLSAEALSYNSRDTQLARFDQLLKLIPNKKQQYTLLDVGCGLGDLANYLLFKGYKNVVYTGVDVVPEMIEGAKRKYPQAQFLCLDIFTQELPTADFVVASGALNIIYGQPQEQIEHIQIAISKMFKLAKTACGFNLLDAGHRGSFEQDDKFYYSDKTKILEICREITPYYELVDGYLAYDFTVLLKKKL